MRDPCRSDAVGAHLTEEDGLEWVQLVRDRATAEAGLQTPLRSHWTVTTGPSPAPGND